MLFARGNAGADKTAVKRIAEAMGISLQVAEVLVCRGLDTPELAADFLSEGQMHDPMSLDGVPEACAIIEQALEEGQAITIFGDYDCDGICASAILYDTFTAIGAEVYCMLPSRELEGYGLNENAVRQAAETSGLLLTVDCGITNLDEVRLAKELGLSVIVTDHHRALEELPQADAIINPHIAKNYPFSDLCGSGVALKLAQAILQDDGYELLDLAALATVADIVPLLGENRAIVKAGLELINEAPRPGIEALAEQAGLKGKEINAGRIAFTLAPRLNSAGRMGDAMRGIELMVSDDQERIEALAKELNDENVRRQGIEEKITISAKEQAHEQAKEKLSLVVADKDWHSGVIGIVASKLTDLYHRPCAVVSINDDGTATGSMRGIHGTHIFNALNSCEDILLRHGGHEMAGGFTLATEKIEEFSERIEAFFRNNCDMDIWQRRETYDLALQPKDITLKLARDLELLAPCGFGNPAPVVLLPGVRVESATAMGKNQEHLRVNLGADGRACEAVVFHKGAGYLKQNFVYDVIASIGVNEWNGKAKPQCVVKERRLSQKGYADYPNTKSAEFAYMFMGNIVNKGENETIPIAESAIEFACNKLEECAFGRLVLANTPHAAAQLINELKKRDRLDGASINMTRTEIPVSLDNIILFAPEKSIDFADYSDIIYIDSPVQDITGKRCYAAQKDEYAMQYAKQLAMEREGMGKAYKAFESLGKKRFVSFQGMCEQAAQAAGLQPQQVAAAYYVFESLGFVSFGGNIVTMNQSKKRSLTDCVNYRILLQMAGR